MAFLRRISIRNFLMGVVGALVLILTALSVNNVVNTYLESKETSRVDIANELGDYILEAAGLEAKERGVTSIALGADSVESSAASRITEARTGGDEALKKALGLAEKLSEKDGKNTLLKTALANSRDAFARLEAGRREVDRSIETGSRNYSPKEWFNVITGLMDSTAELRLAAFYSTDSRQSLQEALRLNIELKQAVWLVGEYAGRERALVGSFVSGKKPFDAASLEKINTFRAIVELNVKPVLRLKDAGGVDPEVIKSVTRMEEVFLGSFSEVRSSVIAAGATGSYPISGKEWIEKSTEAINTILEVSGTVGKMVDGKVRADLAASKRNMAASVAGLLLFACAGLGSLWVIKNKVVSPMHYLNRTVSGIEATGDLTMKIEVKSSDESGQIASAFNKMLGKFHHIIQEIHASIETLASSSEELSASAVQIAGGSKAQSSKAAQVSTASQEMSATIVDVAKNVSAASDAAREASAVAVKGGGIVSSTIESMNGIANTAKESSRIISTLGGRSQEIGNIINVIEDIADQTNLLALNAAIEAARAGEQGRGFAVVADEVRKLAEKTMKATKEIGDMIKAMQDETDRAISSVENEVQAVEKGVKLASNAGDSLKEIVEKVDIVTSMIHQISTATEQQSAATEQISGDIESVASVISETSASAQQIANASQDIAELATTLKSKVELFKISREHAEKRKAEVVELRPAPAQHKRAV